MARYDIEGAQDIATETQAYDAQGVAAQAFATSLRSLSGTAAALTSNTRAVRLATTGSLANDLFYETDTRLLYRWTGTAWAFVAGWASGADATRTALSISSVDNGARFLTTDTERLWEVSSGAWVERTIVAKKLLETSGPATLTLGAVADGQTLVRSGSTLIGAAAAGGTVTSVSVVTANGISGSVATSTTTPAITLTLGAITPTSVAASGTVTGSNLSGTHSGSSSGTNTGDQTITLTGDVTGSGTGSFAATIANSSVTPAKMANMATASLLGRNTAGTGSVEVLSASTAKTLLSLDNVENTAISTWGGSANIATVGTITTGTWNATTIAVNKGGTGDTGTAWTNYTPTITSESGSFTSVSATGYYKTIGKTCFLMIRVTITTNGTAAGNVKASLPIAANAHSLSQAGPWILQGRENGVSGKTLTAALYPDTSTLAVTDYTGAYPGASGAKIDVVGVYETV